MKICEFCGEEYIMSVNRPNRKFCSSVCRVASFRASHEGYDKEWRDRTGYEAIRDARPERRAANVARSAAKRKMDPGYLKRWRHENPVNVKMHAANRDARKLGNGGSFTADEFVHLCSANNWRCAYCGIELTEETATSDHIVPLAHGGTSYITNIAPACRRCNSAKGTKSMAEFMEGE